MAEPIVINAETREITVPESERSFGVAGEHNVARKHFRINGRIVDGNDLAVGFAWKVCTENSAKQPNEYPIDSIIADSDGIEFDWLVGKGALTYKGSLKFAVCAKQVNGEGKVQHEWHSRIGTGTVYDGIEASAEDIGGFDLRAYIQQTADEVRRAVQDAAASAKMQRRRPAMQTRLQSLPPTTLRPPRNRQTMQQLPPKRLAMRQLRLSRRA